MDDRVDQWMKCKTILSLLCKVAGGRYCYPIIYPCKQFKCQGISLVLWCSYGCGGRGAFVLKEVASGSRIYEFALGRRTSILATWSCCIRDLGLALAQEFQVSDM